MRSVSKFFLQGHLFKDNARVLPWINNQQQATLKYYPPPVQFNDVTKPEFQTFKRYPKVPLQPPNYPRAARAQPKMLHLMRGDEEVHNFLLYKQCGLQALIGGRLASKHFEFLYNAISRWVKNDVFAVWRVDPPWQAVSKKGGGKKMGKGKAPIHHYVTPVKTGRIIVEIGGPLDPLMAEMKLAPLAGNLPFKARFVTQEILEKEKERKKWEEENNLNPYTFKYCVLNNMGGCNNWLSPYDYVYLDGRR